MKKETKNKTVRQVIKSINLRKGEMIQVKAHFYGCTIIYFNVCELDGKTEVLDLFLPDECAEMLFNSSVFCYTVNSDMDILGNGSYRMEIQLAPSFKYKNFEI